MKLNGLLRFIASYIFLNQLTACASAPEYLYSIEADSAMSIRPLNNELPNVLVAPVFLPELIDRPQLVIRNGEYNIEINEQQRWATPLKESIPRVISAELGQRLDGQNFIAASPSIITKLSARLLIEISSLDMSRQEVTLVAHWAYHPTNKELKTIEGLSQVKSTAKTTAYIDYVDATRQATLALADDIAKQLMK